MKPKLRNFTQVRSDLLEKKLNSISKIWPKAISITYWKISYAQAWRDRFKPLTKFSVKKMSYRPYKRFCREK